MPTEKSLSLRLTEHRKDAEGLLDAERDTLPSSSELPHTPSLDAELTADVFYLSRFRSGVPSDVSGVDSGWSLPVIHNAFWIAGKVPSLNDLLSAKSGGSAPILSSLIMRYKPGKGKQSGARFSLYNDIKQDWKRRTVKAIGTPFVRCEKAYFGYLIVEETLKRDPSNICSAAVKFIEDGLVEAGVIPNDGWNQILGIRVHWVHRKGREPGVYVVMSDSLLPEERLVAEYEDNFF